MWWCAQGTQYERQYQHVFWADVQTPPTDNVLELMRIDQRPAEPIVPDDEFFAAGGARERAPAARRRRVAANAEASAE
eukprot:1473722-Lingulodinium_polyedra.AAC.1